jgi:hypothetical protein
MRAIFLAVLIAAGIGLVGASNISAAPIGGAAIGESANHDSNVMKVQHWRWGSGGHYRWGSRGYHRHRCHFRYRSGSYWC